VSPARPVGLSLNASTGVLSGVPTVDTATTVYTITGTNTAGNTSVPVVLTVSATPPSGFYQPITFTANSPTTAGHQAVIDLAPGNALWAHVAYADGRDLRVSDTDNNPLDFWVELFDATNQRARFRTRSRAARASPSSCSTATAPTARRPATSRAR
jgi:hypothetical protein